MSSQRNRLLINLSHSKSQHHNVTYSATMASELNREICGESEKENDMNGSNLELPGTNDPYESSLSNFDSRNISPLIPLSESQLDECLSENLGDVDYTELLPVGICCTPVRELSASFQHWDEITTCQEVEKCTNAPVNSEDQSQESNIYQDLVTISTSAIIEHCLPSTSQKVANPAPRYTRQDCPGMLSSSFMSNDDIITEAPINESSVDVLATSRAETPATQGQEQLPPPPKKVKRVKDPKVLLEL